MTTTSQTNGQMDERTDYLPLPRRNIASKKVENLWNIITCDAKPFSTARRIGLYCSNRLHANQLQHAHGKQFCAVAYCAEQLCAVAAV